MPGLLKLATARSPRALALYVAPHCERRVIDQIRHSCWDFQPPLIP
jgi:hypothetical protein